MIEDLTYKCDGCGAREIVRPSYQETARMDGALGMKTCEGVGGYHLPVQDHDRVLVKRPEGWDPRFGPNGTALYHRCPKCRAADVRFA